MTEPSDQAIALGAARSTTAKGGTGRADRLASPRHRSLPRCRPLAVAAEPGGALV